jgi:hypothetical protein
MKSRLFNVLLNVLLDLLTWALRARDANSGNPVVGSAAHVRIPQRDFRRGGRHA